jgi:hypothetical protein
MVSVNEFTIVGSMSQADDLNLFHTYVSDLIIIL